MKVSYLFHKLLVSLVLVLSYLFLPRYGFTAFVPSAFPEGIIQHILYPFSHANIWHLAGNILCLFMIRAKLHLTTSYLCAVLCSFLPCFCEEPTTGFSGVLFCIVGISWGKIHRFREMIWRNKWFLIIPAFLPHINFLIHIYCLLAGYMYGSVCCHATTTKK